MFDSPGEASADAAGFITGKLKKILHNKRNASIVLPGGSAPRNLNTPLRNLLKDMDTNRIDWFFGDERAVEPGSSSSNYRMQNETLFEPLKIDQKHIHRIKGELGAKEAAGDYNNQLSDYFSISPVFDIIILGLGPDGHTASLFPGYPELSIREFPVTGTQKAPLKPYVERITLTLPVINTAQTIIFFTGRTGKEKMIERVCSSSVTETSEKDYPFELIKSVSSPVNWFIYGNES